VDLEQDRHPRIGILIVAYNTAATLADVLDRIPSDIAGLSAVLVSDNHSEDDTYDVGVAYSNRYPELPITVVRQSRNLGYGGNQKVGYRWAIDQGLDIVVMVHGDGQYAPELLPSMVAPLLADDADVVMGSRMMTRGHARAGGMPLYKFVGNRILTRYQNAVAGLDLSEWHSGYRAFSVKALARIPFERNSDGYDFDTEVLLQLAASGARVTEIPIPTYYGDEICYVNGMAYAKDVALDVTRARLARIGFGTPDPGTVEEHYEWKPGPDSSHHHLTELVTERPATRMLDLGCGEGQLARLAHRHGHDVTAIDPHPPAVGDVDGVHYMAADLDGGLPKVLRDDEPFQTVVAANVLEHVRRPGELLSELTDITTPDVELIACIPNFAHWYPRLRVASGHFDYDRRGILDSTHVRFFTRRSFLKMASRAGWRCEQIVPVGLPFDVVERGGRPGIADRLRRTVGVVDRWLVKTWPNLFAFQFVAVLSRWEAGEPLAMHTAAPLRDQEPTPIPQ
jgi:2-polyprenyl-3-methyl-5-hydroxy-6-metoxy-1,4-benzoquinol methylase